MSFNVLPAQTILILWFFACPCPQRSLLCAQLPSLPCHEVLLPPAPQTSHSLGACSEISLSTAPAAAAHPVPARCGAEHGSGLISTPTALWILCSSVTLSWDTSKGNGSVIHLVAVPVSSSGNDPSSGEEGWMCNSSWSCCVLRGCRTHRSSSPSWNPIRMGLVPSLCSAGAGDKPTPEKAEAAAGTPHNPIPTPTGFISLKSCSVPGNCVGSLSTLFIY